MTTPERQRRRQQLVVGLLLANLALLLFLVGYVLLYLNPKTEATQAALCAQRANLQQQVAATQQFLEHPREAPTFNDPKTRSLIRAQLPAEILTISIYGALGCD